MKQGTKKTFHLDCVGLIVEVDRWSDRRRRETTGRHISRTVWRTAQRGSPLRQRADVQQPPSAEDFCPGCTLETRLACSQPTQDRHHSSSFCSSSPLDHFACHSTAPAAAAGAGAGAAPPRGAGCYQRLAHKTSRSSILSTTIFDYI